MPTFRTSDDVNLSSSDEGSGRPVVLIHGYAAPAAAWAIRGHHLGASMGGNAIWAYVDQFGSGRLAGVVIDDQTPKMINTADWPYGFYDYTPENAGILFAYGIPPTTPARNREPSAPAMMRLLERLGGPPAVRGPAAHETIKLLNDHALADWRDVVARFDKPFVMVAARQSQLWPCEHARAAVGTNPYGRVVLVDDCGNTVCFDQPDRFVEIVSERLVQTGDGRA